MQSITEKWIFFLKEAPNLAFIPENIDDERLKESYIYANKFNWTKKELDEYEKASIFKGDLKNAVSTAERKGEIKVKKKADKKEKLKWQKP